MQDFKTNFVNNLKNMSIDYFLSRVLRIFTLISLGLTLLFIYRGLPDPVAVHFGETGRGDGFLPKAEVFYLLAGVISVLNILVLLLIKTVEKIPAINLGSLNQLFSDKAPESIKKISIDWLHFFPVAIHSYLILILRTLLLLNDERTRNQDFSYLPMVGICLLLLWLIYLPARLLSLPKSDLLE
jgi:uncharacterized membrane protein